MNIILKLEKSDIITRYHFENIAIVPPEGPLVILSREAAEELRNDLTQLLAEWEPEK